jgi:ATP-dependent Clp protease protease subunit
MFKKLLVSLSLLSTTALAFPYKRVDLTVHNTVTLRGEVSTESVTQWIQAIESLETDDVILYLDSPGGSVIDGRTFIDYMQGSGKKFTCVADFSASMAFVILQYCDVRHSLPSSIIMQHQMSYGAPRRPARQQEAFTELLKNIEKELEEHQAKRIGITTEKFKELYQHDWWLTGKQAKGFNVVDSIVTVRCSSHLRASKQSTNVTFMVYVFEVVYSGCPILKEPLSIQVANGSQEDGQDRRDKERQIRDATEKFRESLKHK